MPGSSGAGWGSAGSEEVCELACNGARLQRICIPMLDVHGTCGMEGPSCPSTLPTPPSPSQFHLIDVDELPAEPQEPQRRAGFGPFWRRAAAAAPRPAGASAHLAPIPIVSLTHSGGDCTAAHPASSTLSCATDAPQAGSASLGEAAVGTWLQQAQPGWGLLPPSHNGSSVCSGISFCSTSQAGSSCSSSSVAHSRGSSCSWPLDGPGGRGGQGGSSAHSSSSRLLNLLMLQAEAGDVAAEGAQPLPAAGAVQLACTPNPLLQQEQAALLRWAAWVAEGCCVV